MADAAIHGHARRRPARVLHPLVHVDEPQGHRHSLPLHCGGSSVSISVTFTVYMRMELMHPGVQYMCLEGARLIAGATADARPTAISGTC